MQENKITRTNGLVLLLSALATTILNVPLSAQTDAGGVYMLEEIVVTARRREESLQDVPISITAFDAAALARKDVNSLRDLEFSVPNMSFTDQGNAFGGFSMRGIYTLVRNIGIESGVAVYVDGVYQGRNSNSNLDIIDIERIEVLKGPQGTNFGRNTISGAINITTKKPTDEFEAAVKGSYGNLDRFGVNAYASGPLVEGKLSARASVSHFERDGFTRNLFNGNDLDSEARQGARMAFRYTPNDRLAIDASADWLQDRGDRARGGYLVAGAGGFGAEFDRTRNPRVTDIDGGPGVNGNPGGNFEDRDIWGINVTIDYEFSNGYSINSITAYREGDFFLNSDFDGASTDVASGFTTNDSEQYTQELKLSSPNNMEIEALPGSFDFVSGFFYLGQDTSSSLRSRLGLGGTVATSGAPFFGGAVAGGPVVFGPDAEVETTAWAVYVDANWHLTDKLTFSAGFRYSDEEKDLVFQQTPAAAIGIPAIPLTMLDLSESDVSPTFSITYEPMEDMLFYGTISQGFKSAGFNADVVGNTNIAFDAETVTNYELGMKSFFLNRRLQLNAAGFFQDYSDLQVQQFIGTAQQVTNAASAEIYGIELEATALLTEALTLQFSLGYLDAEFEDFPNATPAGDNFAGNKLQSAPELSTNAALEYARPIQFGPSTDMYLRGEWSYRGEMYYQANNAAFTRQGGFSMFNLRGGLSFMDGKYEVSAFAQNVSNKVYASNRLPFLGEQMGFWGLPRIYGVEVTARF